ncbi:MAG: hypothetical protein RBS80_17605 [Thermoguttaceae bacterium]|jgi:hypothetical protein|nr:hypothetical protein [Thermoguttaceae bacterium]
MQTPVLSILLFVLASLFGAVGQFLYKAAAQTICRELRDAVLALAPQPG